jgi:hypothetical protein
VWTVRLLAVGCCVVVQDKLRFKDDLIQGFLRWPDSVWRGGALTGETGEK